MVREKDHAHAGPHGVGQDLLEATAGMGGVSGMGMEDRPVVVKPRQRRWRLDLSPQTLDIGVSRSQPLHPESLYRRPTPRGGLTPH